MQDLKKKAKDIREFIGQYRYAPQKVVTAADRIISMRRTKGHWEVITEIIKLWASLKPSHYQSYLVSLANTKSSRKSTWVGGKEFTGVSKDKDTGGYLAYTVDVPVKVMAMIRKVYDAEDLPMDKKFFYEFGKRFPLFRVMQKKG